jgi:hypothetical protein
MRPRHQWTLEVCTAIHGRWMRGETLRDIAREIQASPHALSRAILHHGLPTPFSQSHVVETRLQVRAAPAPGLCRIEDCGSAANYRGMCERHYKMARRYEAVDLVGAPRRVKRARVANGR